MDKAIQIPAPSPPSPWGNSAKHKAAAWQAACAIMPEMIRRATDGECYLDIAQDAVRVGRVLAEVAEAEGIL